MAAEISFDTSELRALSADLSAATTDVVRKVPAVVFKGAMNIKKQLVDEMRASTHFKGVAAGIDFDITDGGFGADVGPRKGAGEPGNLANVAYFGTSRGGGTVPDPQVALEAEAPKFEKALLDLFGDVL